MASLLVLMIDLLLLTFLNWLHPEEEIEAAIDFNYKDYIRKGPEKFGDPSFRVEKSKKQQCVNV